MARKIKVVKPTVSVIVPCRNEKGYIEAAIKSMLSQNDVEGGFEIIVADGMSDDGTRVILDRLVEQDTRLRVIDNPGRIVPTGLNAAIRYARGEIIIRMDAHTEYAQDYIKQCVVTLLKTGADNVGGPWRATGKGYLQEAIALAFQSSFCSGGAGSHQTEHEGEVDSVYLGCWKKARLEQLGFFDEELVRNQDDELNLRITRQGGTIWQSPAIRSWYYPRASLSMLFRQYKQYGYWKVRVVQKHRLPASFRHLIPGAFLGMLLLLAICTPFVVSARWLFAFVGVLYSVSSVVASLKTCRAPRCWKYLPVMPLAFAAYHFGYGWGFLCGLRDFVLLRKSGSDSFKLLTRVK